jgi:hypothetical protein
MQCASSMTSSPTRAARPGSTSRANQAEFSRSGEMASRSTVSAASSAATASHSSRLDELMVRARRPIRVAAASWSRIRASSGLTSSAGPAPDSRCSRAAMK